jgi:hypothetical protein
MWLYTNKGFLSVVENFHEKSEFLVRGRYKGDIEAHFPDADIEVDAGTDYKYRTYLPKEVVAVRLQKYLESELNYSNYKNSVKDTSRLVAYHDVWATMKHAQDEAARLDIARAY